MLFNIFFTFIFTAGAVEATSGGNKRVQADVSAILIYARTLSQLWTPYSYHANTGYWKPVYNLYKLFASSKFLSFCIFVMLKCFRFFLKVLFNLLRKNLQWLITRKNTKGSSYVYPPKKKRKMTYEKIFCGQDKSKHFWNVWVLLNLV